MFEERAYKEGMTDHAWRPQRHHSQEEKNANSVIGKMGTGIRRIRGKRAHGSKRGSKGQRGHWDKGLAPAEMKEILEFYCQNYELQERKMGRK